MSAPLLIVMALEVEAQGLFAELGVDVLFTGLGKVNATHRLTRRLVEARSLKCRLETNPVFEGERPLHAFRD